MGKDRSREPEKKPDPDNKSGENIVSAVKWVPIQEKVGWSQGRYTVVNILKPSIRVERTPLHMPVDPTKKDREDFIRIILTFKLQVDIAGFDRGGGYSAGNRFFDNISLRYLFAAGERHKLTPKTDPIQSSIKTTNETTHTKSLDTGITGVTPTTFAPKIEAHITSEGKVTVEQDNQKSWRSGLSFEAYDPPCLCHCRHHQNHHTRCHHCYHLHDHNYHHSRNCGNHYHSYSSGDLITLSPVLIPKHHHHHHPKHHFTLKSEHGQDCTCDKQFSPHACHLQQTGAVIYDKAAHWAWQARADIELWGPENYESKSRQITIVREVNSEEIDPWVKKEYPTEKDAKEAKEHLRKYLHFDFILSSRLRELDHGWNGFMNSFRKLPKPPEMRRKADTGMPLKADRASFCISPCYEMVEWPPGKTRDTLKEAVKIATGEMKSKDGKILTNEDYQKYKAKKKREEKAKEKEAARKENPVMPTVQILNIDRGQEEEAEYWATHRRQSPGHVPEYRRRSDYENPSMYSDYDEYWRERGRQRRRSISPHFPPPPPPPRRPGPPRPGGYYQTGPVPVFLQQQREYGPYRFRSPSIDRESILEDYIEIGDRRERFDRPRRGQQEYDEEIFELGRGRSRSRTPEKRAHGQKQASRSSSEGSVVKIVHNGRRPGKPANNHHSHHQQEQQQESQTNAANAAADEEILRLRRESEAWHARFEAERAMKDFERWRFQAELAELRRFRVRSLSPSPRRPRRRYDFHSPRPTNINIRVQSTSRVRSRSRSRSRDRNWD